jgi:pimeloyl-ACP methyl ester carboxylesterase
MQAREIPQIWREASWPAEWLALRTSAVFQGFGIPHGDGSPVLVVPGFMSGDTVMYEMFRWLGRIGYRPYLSGISVNASCPGQTSARLGKIVDRAHRETGQRVRIVGHSLGGLLGRHVALGQPEQVAQVIYLGSPIRSVQAHPAVVATAGLISGVRSLLGGGDSCFTDACGCGLAKDAERPLPRTVEHAAIYTQTDGVVDWHSARERDWRRNFEVGGTHVGLVWNPRAYKVLANLLAGAPVA